jgi:hypothetical protein
VNANRADPAVADLRHHLPSSARADAIHFVPSTATHQKSSTHLRNIKRLHQIIVGARTETDTLSSMRVFLAVTRRM